MTIEVPNEALPLILLQRTGLQRLNFRFLRKLGTSYHPRICAWECRWRGAAIRRDFTASILTDYEQIKTHLPAQAGTILDIGCGVAGIDVALHRHYATQPPQFRLLDKSAVSERVFYDFHAAGAFYNSLEAASRVLTCNGVAEVSIQRFEANEENIIPLADGGTDLILSLISWGFHYPVADLPPGGCAGAGSGRRDDPRRAARFGGAGGIARHLPQPHHDFGAAQIPARVRAEMKPPHSTAPPA